jgi:hypothetical protein
LISSPTGAAGRASVLLKSFGKKQPLALVKYRFNAITLVANKKIGPDVALRPAK